MGLHLPGSAFVHPGTPLRDALVGAAAKRAMVERALAEPDYDLPVAAILRQDRAPVSILWAP